MNGGQGWNECKQVAGAEERFTSQSALMQAHFFLSTPPFAHLQDQHGHGEADEALAAVAPGHLALACQHDAVGHVQELAQHEEEEARGHHGAGKKVPPMRPRLGCLRAQVHISGSAEEQ